MQSNTSPSLVLARRLVATFIGAIIGFYFFSTITATVTGAIIGFFLGSLWQ